jgi:hypothetical protein
MEQLVVVRNIQARVVNEWQLVGGLHPMMLSQKKFILKKD